MPARPARAAPSARSARYAGCRANTIVTHAQNWTLRQNRSAAFEQNPSSAPNLWFLTYRDNSPLQAENRDAYRDPDALTYKAYVNLQSDAEAKVQGVLEARAAAAAAPESAALLGQLFTPARYLYHGFQQVEAYIGYMAPSSYITNAAGFAAADFLRRVTGPRPDPGRRAADPARRGRQAQRRRPDLAARLLPGHRFPAPRPVEPGPG
jgi:toluene monooxygenase system protein E